MAIGAFSNPFAGPFQRYGSSALVPVFPQGRVPAGPPVSGYGGFGAVAGPILRALTAYRAQQTPVAWQSVPVPPPDAVPRPGAPEATRAMVAPVAWENVPALGPVLRRDERAPASQDGSPGPGAASAVPALGLDAVLRRVATQGELPGLPGIASGFGLIGGSVRALGAPGLDLDYWNNPSLRYAMSFSNDPWTRYMLSVTSRAPFVPPTWPRLGRVV